MCAGAGGGLKRLCLCPNQLGAVKVGVGQVTISSAAKAINR